MSMSNVPVIHHYYELMDDRAAMIAELKIVLDEVGSDHALIGGLAAGHHGRPRATIDVDLLVPGRKLKALTRALTVRGYVITSFLPDMIRVYPPGADPASAEAIADLVSKDANPVLRAAFAAVEPAQVLGHAVKIVKRGAFIALKYQAATSSRRAIEDRYQDLTDLGRVLKKRFEPEDRTLALEIARHMYPGAPHDLEKVIADLQAGRPVTL